ncbi:terminase large subunit [Aeromonas hydrophila]|uniref:terminase large subunit n=1 Tax=Aeromonas hydrophila TaxID=644 RepID=UPI003D1DDB8A
MFKYNPKVGIRQFDFRTNEPTLTDEHGNSITSPYFQGWQAVYQYVHDVLSGFRHTSKVERQTVERFVNDLTRDDLYFDYFDFEYVLEVANSLKHTKGPIGGSNIMLLNWQQFLLFNVYAIKYSKNHPEPEVHFERKYHTLYLQIARGNGKSQFGGIFGIVTFLLTENKEPTVTSSASTREQARIVYDEIKGMVLAAPKSIRKRFKVFRTHIAYMGKGGGKMLPTSSQAGSIEGTRLSCALLDEVHLHPDGLVTEAASNGMGSSKEPLLVQITTAGNNITSHCHDVYEYCKTILNGTCENDRYYVHIFEAEEGDDAGDPISWEKANPSLDHAVSRSKLKSDYLTAQMSPSAMASFEIKRLNRWYQFAENGFVDSDFLNKCKTETDIEQFQKEEAYIGIDFAERSDLSTVSLVVPQGDDLHVKTKSFIPEAVLETIPKNVIGIYNKARMNGTLIVTPGEVTDMDAIHEYVNQLHMEYDICGCGVDAAAGGARWAVKHDDQYNQEVVAVNQGFGLSSPSSLIQRKVATQEFKIHKDDTMLEWAMLNGRVKEGTFGDIYVHRPTNNKSLKIDPLISTIIATSMIPIVDSSVSIR